ncbi:hypothetical protein [Aliikangiella sp. G2MR2-5]|uniref:hypothetical protein n=1 Tax=Aliikangiella sp. G2MR2-5 TaxID=2788943 RepID=UPI0018A9D30C|nr:hypothetical protein [Aliikangiella sp. G2MR2-5]
MSQVNTLQSLDLILEDVSAETNLAINSLEQYSKKSKEIKLLKKSLAHLQKLKGVFTLLDMRGAQRLVLDCMNLLKTLPKRKDETRARLLGVATTALARLMRYSEHMNHKPFDMPQLLLVSINELRASANVPLLSESVFFSVDGTKPRENQSLVLVTSEESAAKSRHFRQMYQIGLIEVIRQTNLSGGLKMMQKAIDKLDNECPRPNSPNLWWIASGLLQAYIDETLTLTKPRIKLFSRLDRQIRKVENKQENLLEDNKLEVRLLTKDMLYLVSISDSSNPLIQNIKEHFNIEESEVTDKLLREEFEALRGPSDQDYKSIAEAILTEVDNIEGTLRNGGDERLVAEDMELAKRQMTNLNNLLKILQVDEQAIRLTVAIDLVNKALNEGKSLDEKDLNILFIVLETIRKSTDESELLKHSGKGGVRRETLSKTEKQFWKQADKGLKKLIKALNDFVKHDRKASKIKQVPELIDDVSQNFIKLKVTPAESILDGCSLFIQNYLMTSPESVGESELNLLADIIGSLEFYLETLAFTKSPSPRILQFAENSLDELKRKVRAQH